MLENVERPVFLAELQRGGGGRPREAICFAAAGGHVGFINGGTPWNPTFYLPNRILSFLQPFAAMPGL